MVNPFAGESVASIGLHIGKQTIVETGLPLIGDAVV